MDVLDMNMIGEESPDNEYITQRKRTLVERENVELGYNNTLNLGKRKAVTPRKR